MSRPAYESWFSTLGAPLGAGELAELAAYLEGLGLDAPPELVTDWPSASATIHRPADARWCQAEEARQAALQRTVQLDPADRAWIALNDALHGAAAVAAMRFGCSDAGMIKAAAGAASFAAHQAELATAAGCDANHPFRRKFALFEAGRWPLGLYAGRFAIF